MARYEIAAYIDVRGPWPILIIGSKCWVLEHQDRSITVDRAKELIGI